jgi:hypothetical protein
MVMTTKELAELLNCEYAVAAALIKLGVATGQIKEAGERPSSAGRGKPSSLFELPATLNFNLMQSYSTRNDSDQAVA